MNIWHFKRRVLTAGLNVAAIVLGTLTQFILVAFLCSVLPLKLGLTLLLISPFALGVGNYFLYQRLTRERTIRTAAERWLTDHSKSALKERARKLRMKQIALWAPTVIVTVALLFLPETFGVATHLLRPGPARLSPYDVHLPLSWMAFYVSDSRWYSTEAFQCKGPLRSGFRRYWHLAPLASGMNFWVARNRGQFFPENRDGETISVRTFQLGSETLSCREYVHVSSHFENDKDLRACDCRNVSGTFEASFFGDKSSVPEFYRTLQNIRVEGHSEP